jgi:hypothetical protein
LRGKFLNGVMPGLVPGIHVFKARQSQVQICRAR